MNFVCHFLVVPINPARMLHIPRICNPDVAYVTGGKSTAQDVQPKSNNWVELFGTTAPGEDLTTLQPVRAHKMILMYASKHLHELFTIDGYIDSHQTQYTLTEIGHESLNDIVKFFYTKELNFDVDCASERMQKVLVGAKFLVMLDLANACETYLANDSHLTLKNCMCMLRFARKYACLSLLEATLNLAARNLPHFTGDLDFLALSEEEVGKLLLSEPVITIADADQRCRAAVAWLNYDRLARDACISDILNMVPFDLKSISLETLADVKKNSAIRSKYAEKFMDVFFEGVGNYRHTGSGDQVCSASNRTVSDVWRSACSSSDLWHVIGGVQAPTKHVVYDVKRQYWWKLPDLPWTRAYAGVCVMGNKTIVVAAGEKNGRSSADIDLYDLSEQEWTTSSTKLSVTRKCVSACVSTPRSVGTIANGQSMMVIGGYPASTCNVTEKFCISGGVGKFSFNMERMLDMPVGRFNASAGSVNDAVYVAGGCRHDLTDTRLSSIEKYDCVANKWSTAGNLKCGRSAMIAGVLGDDLYFAGGYDGKSCVDVVEVFDTRTGQIRQAASLRQARYGGGGVALDHNTFCVVGGCVGGDDSPSLRSVECLDIREGRWTTGVIVPDMPTANCDFGFACV